MVKQGGRHPGGSTGTLLDSKETGIRGVDELPLILLQRQIMGFGHAARRVEGGLI